MNTFEAMKRYFQAKLPFESMGLDAVHLGYNWKLPPRSFDGKPLSFSGTNFEANIELKLNLNESWHSKPESRKKIVKWIVADWGGIRGNKEQTLENYYQLALKETPPTPLSGIASFSKVLAIKNPLKYAIYDARVAVSLNAIQMVLKASEGKAFPYLPGRNNITGNWNYKKRKGFSVNKASSIQTLTSAPYAWEKVPDDKAYTVYLELLEELSKVLSVPIYCLEMALFSQAEELACLAIPSLN